MPLRPTAAAESRRDSWWEGAVGYEIYVRSFADSNGDGIGDLPGIEARLEHAAWLGVDIVWLTPFMPSPGHDHGYDISDYCSVDPAHGSLDDFEKLARRAHELGLRVLVDLVPNHTSSAHPWFVDSASARDSQHRGWYIWADPAPDGGPPNNWVSHFGGPAWTLDQRSGQYYCHLFLPEQPDLNWSNPDVRDAFDDILGFWCDRGADGFRIDVAHSLLKNLDLTDNPVRRSVGTAAGPSAVFESFDHTHDLDQDDNIDIYRRWRSVTDPYGAMLVGEVNVTSAERSARYTEPGALHTVFFLKPAWSGWNPVRLLRLFQTMNRADPDGVSWTMNSHDTSRSVSRFGGGQRGLRRSLAVTTLQFTLGGVPFLYQGEELGLDDARVAPGDRADPIWTRNDNSVEIGRDGSRGPMAWSAAPTNGFTTGAPWLPAADRPPEQTAEHQRSNPDSTLHRYRELITVRKTNPELHREPLHWIDTDDQHSVAGRRGSMVFVANLGPEALTIELGAPLETLFCSADEAVVADGPSVTVPAEATLLGRQSL